MRYKIEKYTDKSGDKKYFAIIPYYIINHSSAYEQSLYLVMKRIASEEGTCWASAITIGEIMKVSPNTVRKYQDKLLKRGWIKIVGSKGKTKPTNEFEIVDLWKLNMDYYAKKESSTDEQSFKESSTDEKIVQPVSLVSSPGGNKEETIKNKQEEDILAIQRIAEKREIDYLIELFKEVNPSYKRLFPNTTQRSAIERLLKEHGREKLELFINTLSKTNSMKYAPTITTPLVLENKLGDLIAFIKREQGQINKIVL